ncbi:MAG: ThuA domain-containing protein, partial [Gammaproteobacteria bacterium]
PLYMQMLGSQFQAHPPIAPFLVQVSKPDHPLVQGIEPFETTDELYLAEYHGENTPLLHCEYKGTLNDFEHSDWEDDSKHLVFYLHPYAAGEVLYLTLGHCRGKYDMQPLTDEYYRVERCSWEQPIYYELLRRGIRWAANLQI